MYARCQLLTAFTSAAFSSVAAVEAGHICFHQRFTPGDSDKTPLVPTNTITLNKVMPTIYLEYSGTPECGHGTERHPIERDCQLWGRERSGHVRLHACFWHGGERGRIDGAFGYVHAD